MNLLLLLPVPGPEFRERNFPCRRCPDTAAPTPRPSRTRRPSAPRTARRSGSRKIRSAPCSSPPDISCSPAACDRTRAGSPPTSAGSGFCSPLRFRASTSRWLYSLSVALASDRRSFVASPRDDPPPCTRRARSPGSASRPSPSPRQKSAPRRRYFRGPSWRQTSAPAPPRGRQACRRRKRRPAGNIPYADAGE